MTDYQIQNNSRRCCRTGRDLRPGEKYFSVLLDEAGKFVRQDYAAEVWTGPAEGAFSFWAGRVPAGEARRIPRIDDDLLMDCFQRLEGRDDPGRINFRYVVALLLMRRKRLKFEAVRTEDGQEITLLRCPRTRTAYEVANPHLSDEEMAAVQDEVFQVLGWD